MAPPVPTLHVVGSAEREVVPDEVVVRVFVQTPRHASPQDALDDCARRRSRIRAALARGAPDAEVSDGGIGVRRDVEYVEEPDARGRVTSRTVAAGHVGSVALTARGPAGRARALVTAAGAVDEGQEVSRSFEVSRTLARRVRAELEEEAVRDAVARAGGLAAAAGMRAGEVIGIGEPPGAALPPQHAYLHALEVLGDRDGEEDLLGELVPAPVLHRAEVPVRVALLPPAG